MTLLSFSFKWILLFHLEINHRLHVLLYSENKCLSFKHSYLNHYLFSLAHKIQHTDNMGWGWIVLASLKQYLSNMPYFAHFLPCLIPSLKTLLLSLISLSPPSFLFLYHGGIFIVTNVYFYPLYLSLAFSVSLLFPLILFPFPHSPVLLLCFFFNVTLGFIKIAYRALGGDV